MYDSFDAYEDYLRSLNTEEEPKTEFCPYCGAEIDQDNPKIKDEVCKNCENR